jgi:hypothetical protein
VVAGSGVQYLVSARRNMIKWVRIRHSITGGVTIIPEKALSGHEKRGWELVTEEPDVDLLPADPVKEPEEPTNESKTPADDSPEFNDTKENA